LFNLAVLESKFSQLVTRICGVWQRFFQPTTGKSILRLAKGQQQLAVVEVFFLLLRPSPKQKAKKRRRRNIKEEEAAQPDLQIGMCVCVCM